MADREYSEHATTVLAERAIPREWVERTLTTPDQQETRPDGNVHYLKVIQEHAGRVLRVVVNPGKIPERIVTVFFDRRIKGRL
jgi:Domain of unknown function (DUF4258)